MWNAGKDEVVLVFLQDDLLPRRPLYELKRPGSDWMKFVILPPPLHCGRGGHERCQAIPSQDHEEVGGGLLQADLQASCYVNPSSNALASWRLAVSNVSVNQP